MTRKTIIYLNTKKHTTHIAIYDSEGKLIEEKQCKAKIIETKGVNTLIKPSTTSNIITLVVDNAFYKCYKAKIQVHRGQ